MELVDFGARWYDPQIGRFISPDTIIPDPAESQSFNRYAYVYNNPVNHTDPTGHFCPSCTLAAPLLTFGPPGWAAYATLAVVSTAAVGIYAYKNAPEPQTQEEFPLSPPPDPGPLYPQPTLDVGSEYLGGGFTTPLGDVDLGLSTEFPNTIGLELPNILETRNVSGGELTSDKVLDAALEWLGTDGYTEIYPDVFRSTDNERQFRMKTVDLTDPDQGPHVHFESIGPDGRTIIENDHVDLLDFDP